MKAYKQISGWFFSPLFVILKYGQKKKKRNIAKK